MHVAPRSGATDPPHGSDPHLYRVQIRSELLGEDQIHFLRDQNAALLAPVFTVEPADPHGSAPAGLDRARSHGVELEPQLILGADLESAVSRQEAVTADGPRGTRRRLAWLHGRDVLEERASGHGDHVPGDATRRMELAFVEEHLAAQGPTRAVPPHESFELHALRRQRLVPFLVRGSVGREMP